VQPQVQLKSPETKVSQPSTLKFALQAALDRERQDPAHKQPSERWQDSVSALNALKKLLQFPMTAQEDLVAEEEEESKLSSSPLLTEKLK
jgi:hypothetical protein